jgi:hypothetical protein
MPPGRANARIGHDHAGGEDGNPELSGAGLADGCTVACQVAADYRAAGERALRGLAPDKLVVVWDAAARRLVVARTGPFAADLLTWSDRRYIAFGTEPAHLLAAFRAPLFGLLPRPSGTESRGGGPRLSVVGGPGPATQRRLARVRQLAPGDRISVSVAVARRALRTPRPSSLRLVPRPVDVPVDGR